MKNFNSVSNGELLNQTKALVDEERRVGLEILHRLREIERRRLHLELGYSSLFTFCVEELKYSEAAAHRRIQAMRVLVEVPEIESKIQGGALSIATLSQVQSFCQAQKRVNAVQVSVEEKRNLLHSVENKTKRETEKLLVTHFPQPLPVREHVKALNSEESEVRYRMSERLRKKLERIRDLRSHVNFNPTHSELLEDMADLVLAMVDPEKKVTSTMKEAPQRETRTVTLKSKTVVWKRDHGQCAFVAQNGHRCTETRVLEIDHRILKVFGGSNLPANLRLLCKGHNLQEAIRILGKEKMQPYLRL